MTNFITFKAGYSLNRVDPIVTRITTSVDHVGSLCLISKLEHWSSLFPQVLFKIQ